MSDPARCVRCRKAISDEGLAQSLGGFDLCVPCNAEGFFLMIVETICYLMRYGIAHGTPCSVAASRVHLA
ncbi:MAG TPA: hypothetical protein VNJ70_17990 [Thermoanaerobaculia bacterium]|nr:hypothetical protein [Thermoanaerobaculia bacterium]